MQQSNPFTETPEFALEMPERRAVGRELNKLSPEDRPAHDWYRFVLSFPPHLVRDYLEKFQVSADQCVLDPFCGTGTTVVECKKLGLSSIGLEANGIAHFAARVKIDWQIDPDDFLSASRRVAEEALSELARAGICDYPSSSARARTPDRFPGLRRLDADTEKLLLANSVSPVPMHKVLVLRDCLRRHESNRFYHHQMLAFAKAVTFSISNLQFKPEVGVGFQKEDAPVVAAWLQQIEQMAKDLRELVNLRPTNATVHRADARALPLVLDPQSVDVVITSPPYPNEKDYTRTTRLESVLLGFVNTRAELQALKKTLVRSNTRSVYKDDDDDIWVQDHTEVQRIAAAIESRRIEMGKTSGFERLYGRVTKLYFGGMARHLSTLRGALRPGARLAYVVGDQASYTVYSEKLAFLGVESEGYWLTR